MPNDVSDIDIFKPTYYFSDELTKCTKSQMDGKYHMHIFADFIPAKQAMLDT